MNNYRILLDGVELDSNVEGLKNINITYRDLDAAEAQAISFSGTLRFYGDGYQQLKNKLVCSELGHTKECTVMLLDKCCDNQSIITGIIRGSDIKFCPMDCYIEGNIIEDNSDTDKLACLQNTFKEVTI